MNQIEEFEAKRRKQVSRARSVVDITMGIMFTAVGVYLVLDKNTFEFFNMPPRTGNYVLGIMFLVYGGWRIYRGYRKNYFKQ